MTQGGGSVSMNQFWGFGWEVVMSYKLGYDVVTSALTQRWGRHDDISLLETTRGRRLNGYRVCVCVWVLQYLLYVPVAAKVIFTQYLGGSDHNNFYLHMLILAATRYLVGQIGVSLSRWRYLIGKHEIQQKGITFATVDHSSNWYNSL